VWICPSPARAPATSQAELVDEIVCVSVNDPFVMEAWGEVNSARGKVRMLADTNAELTHKLGVVLNAAALGGKRCKRFSAFVVDGVIRAWNVEPDGGGLSCSLAKPMLEAVRSI
jgi:2-Cys peroxiredoxin 5